MEFGKPRQQRDSYVRARMPVCSPFRSLFCSAGRDPPRRAGNFHLRGQMKVTKARGLNTGDPVDFACDQTVGRRPNAPSPCPVGCLRARQVQHRPRRPSTVRSVSPLRRYQHRPSPRAQPHVLLRAPMRCDDRKCLRIDGLARRTRPVWRGEAHRAPQVAEGTKPGRATAHSAVDRQFGRI